MQIGRLARITLAGGGSIFLAWSVVETSAVSALVSKTPGIAATVAPDNPQVATRLAMLEMGQNGGAVASATEAAVYKAFARAPLGEEAFVLAGLRALVESDQDKAERLLEEARRRNPRSRLAHLLLLDRYLRSGNVDEAASSMLVLGTLIPDANRVLVGEMVRFAENPRTSAALQQTLRSNPEAQGALLQHLAAKGSDLNLIMRIAGDTKRPPGTPAPAWQETLVRSLVDRGDVQRAYGLWANFSGIDASSRKAGLYDGRFEKMPGLAPFNWELPGTNIGAAEMTGAPALDVEYYGRGEGELARQLLILAPGSYRLSFRAEGDARGEQSTLRWRVACYKSNTRLLDLPLKDVSLPPREISANFTVPSGCSSQWLRLEGVTSEFAKQQNATIRDLKIEKVGAQS